MSVEESAERIYALLSDALSDVATVRERAERELREAEEQLDYFASLVMICAAGDEHAEPRVRWLASVCGKNAVARSWRRRTRQNAVTEDEREYVRKTLLSAIGEQHSTIATQISVWISKIARIDYPKYWYSLLSDLVGILSSSDPGIVTHGLKTFDMVIEALASRRLLSDRQSLCKAAPGLFQVHHEMLVLHLGKMIEQDSSNRSDILISFDIVVSCLKSLRRLIVHGFTSIRNIQGIENLFSKILENPNLFLCGAGGGTEANIRLSVLAAKLVCQTQERHPLEFHIFLPRLLNVYYSVIVSYKPDVSSDPICCLAAQFLKNVLYCPLYGINSASLRSSGENGGIEVGHLSNPQDASYIQDAKHSANQTVVSFFTPERVDALIRTILTKVFVLRKSELSNWIEDPETLIRDEDLAEWDTESLRHECDEIFKILLVNEKRRIAPMIISLAENVSPQEPLLRDACYRAVGKAVYDLEGLFNFESWLQSQLGPILQAKCSEGIGERIMQARAAWLVGQFAAQLSRESRQAVYGLLVNLMTRADGDRVVSLTAAGAIHNLVEDMGFVGIDFSPHFLNCMNMSFRLLLTSETMQTKRELLQMSTRVIERCPSDVVSQLIPSLASVLAGLWGTNGSRQALNPSLQIRRTLSSTENGELNMLRTCIVLFLTSFIQKVGAPVLEDQNLYRFAIMAIIYGTDMSSNDAGGIYLLEEACELWCIILACSNTYNNELRELFPAVAVILGGEQNNLKEVCGIIQGYVLLGAEQFFQEFGGELVNLLGNCLDNVRDRGCLAIVDVLDMVLQTFKDKAIEPLAPVLQKLLQSSLQDERSQVVTAAYVGLVTRAILLNVEAVERKVFKGSEECAMSFLDLVIEKVDAMYLPQRRKMGALALCGLASRYMAGVGTRQRIPLVLSIVVQVLSELSMKQRNGRDVTDADYANEVSRHGEDGQEQVAKSDMAILPETARRLALDAHDPSTQIDARDACKAMLEELRKVGESAQAQVFQATDPVILRQLEALMTGNVIQQEDR